MRPCRKRRLPAVGKTCHLVGDKIDRHRPATAVLRDGGRRDLPPSRLRCAERFSACRRWRHSRLFDAIAATAYRASLSEAASPCEERASRPIGLRGKRGVPGDRPLDRSNPGCAALHRGKLGHVFGQEACALRCQRGSAIRHSPRPPKPMSNGRQRIPSDRRSRSASDDLQVLVMARAGQP